MSNPNTTLPFFGNPSGHMDGSDEDNFPVRSYGSIIIDEPSFTYGQKPRWSEDEISDSSYGSRLIDG